MLRLAALCCVASIAPGSPASADDLAPPPAIEAEGVPTIPRGLSRALAAYRTVPGYAFGGWLGGRREALVLAGAAPAGQVFSVVTPGAPPHQLTSIAGRVLGCSPRPGRNQFALLYDVDGNEAVQVALFDTPSGEVSRLSDGRSRYSEPRWSPDGRTLAVTGDARNSRDYDLYLIDPDDRQGAPRLLAELTGLATVEAWAPDGSRLLVTEIDVSQGSRLLAIDPQSGTPTVVFPNADSPGLHSPGDPRYAPDGRAIFLSLYDGGQFRRLGRLDPESGGVSILTGGIEADVESFAVSDEGNVLAASIHDDGYSRLLILDAESGRVLARPGIPDGQISSLTFLPGSTECAFNLETTREPSQVYSLVTRTGVLVRWTLGVPGGSTFDPPAPPERFRFESFDGREIPAFVYRPDPVRFPGPRPVLIDLHGGPQAQARPSFLGPESYLVNELGLALIVPNVRGSSGYGLSYLRLDDGERREDAVRDVGALLDWVADQPGLDADRVAVRGGSYGGYLVLAALSRFGDRIAAGIDVAGISDFQSFMDDQPELRLDLLRLEFGDERDPRVQRYFRDISPLRRADRITTPMLVVQGENDPRVPVAEARQIVDAVRGNGVPVWYMLARNEGHGFSRGENLEYLRAVEARFLIEHLRRPRPAPE
ncbi:S9 family peptidase [Tautonia plasticadhaerens]|uniref:Prolyl endopeptidase n=1 Tax=Tautonia plasticadhaerens TaxID=2527974 RepID=A0A518GY38_9BACT|nr:prolyl oligopeptidase family serine peptidase [Tautonia plasticadhaerens]QDV33510.1 Prolyl endopeptidase [Tautonia plasticadhaerens]